MRDLHFIHRFNRPEDPDGSTIVLLHGTGGNEADLMPLARRIAPRATLLGVRGRSTEEGTNRWFRRFGLETFDQADIRNEAEAFAAFVADAQRAYALDPARLTFLGYSNGANLLAALIQLHPDAADRAILLRSMQALEDPPRAELPKTKVLMLNGARDPYARTAPTLRDNLESGGAEVAYRNIDAGHELSPEDVSETARWLSAVLESQRKEAT